MQSEEWAHRIGILTPRADVSRESEFRALAPQRRHLRPQRPRILTCWRTPECEVSPARSFTFTDASAGMKWHNRGTRSMVRISAEENNLASIISSVRARARGAA